ncbi:MAG: hypothetical protein OXI15_16905, partial [Chromatiales bacterium]|nr:hypothetical protein [Chromatiales bacterium]
NFVKPLVTCSWPSDAATSGDMAVVEPVPDAPGRLIPALARRAAGADSEPSVLVVRCEGGDLP